MSHILFISHFFFLTSSSFLKQILSSHHSTAALCLRIKWTIFAIFFFFFSFPLRSVGFILRICCYCTFELLCACDASAHLMSSLSILPLLFHSCASFGCSHFRSFSIRQLKYHQERKTMSTPSCVLISYIFLFLAILSSSPSIQLRLRVIDEQRQRHLWFDFHQYAFAQSFVERSGIWSAR